MFLAVSLQKSLSFPSNSGEEEARDLIQNLLTEMEARLTYAGIKRHPFFSLTDWDHLLNSKFN